MKYVRDFLDSIICYTMLSKKSQKVAQKIICNGCDYICYINVIIKNIVCSIKNNATHNGDNAISRHFSVLKF